VEKGWVKIDGKTDRHFDPDKEETITIKIAVPPKSPAGTCTFRMDAVWVQQPDQGDPGGAIAFTVAETPPPPPFKWWLIPVIAVVLIAIGIGVWLAVKGGGPKVPDLHGQSVTDAATALQVVGLTLDNNPDTVDSKPEDSGKIVSQSPKAGEKASKGQSVKVTLGTQMVTVPLLVGQPFTGVQTFLAAQPGGGLTLGKSTPVMNPNYVGGIVAAQDPPPGAVKRAGTPVDVQVTPLTVVVPNVVGQTLGNALNSLRANFQPPTWYGDATQAVASQSPAAGASVPIGGPVTLTFPPGSCAGRICLVEGFASRQIGLDHTKIFLKNLPPQQ
jgi:beta-lactam-binding protein with PASTA domain